MLHIPNYYYTKFQKNPCVGRNERCPFRLHRVSVCFCFCFFVCVFFCCCFFFRGGGGLFSFFFFFFCLFVVVFFCCFFAFFLLLLLLLLFFKQTINWKEVYMFVCVEVLRSSQPNGVMSSAVSLPNHTFTGQA